MTKFFKKYGFWGSLVFCCLVYLALAYKNPFNNRSLISNLEPYPDTILYSFPAWNWVRGKGWNLGVGEKVIKITVPNTYGILLTPLMWVFKDIRSFYYTNLLFGILTIVFFMLALKNFFGKKNWQIISFFGFLLATNFYFFNQPQLVMTENVNYFLTGLFIYLISLKFKWIHLIPISFLLLISYLLKVSNLVLAGSFLFSFLIKIFWEKLRFLNRKKVIFYSFLFISLTGTLYLPKFLSLSETAFNIKFFRNNFKFYFSCLSGGECRNLWYWQKLVSWDIVVMFIFGVIIMLFDKDKRCLLMQLLTPLILFVFAMSLFIDTEGRHVEILVPIMLVIGSFGVNYFLNKFNKKVVIVLLLLLVNIFLTGYQPAGDERKIISLKKQVGLNFRHKEDPWNYLCIKMVENFMKDKPDAYFGSFLPLFFFDTYDVKVNYLPLSTSQDFVASRGLSNYFEFPLKSLFLEKIENGKEVFLSDYYASNRIEAWRNEWEEIVSVGKLEKVWQSPLDNCNIYKLSEDVEKF